MIAASENCLVYGVSPSCTLRAAHFRAVVHDHDGGLGLCQDIRHARILLQSPYVIYENSAEGQGARCYRRFGRIDRYRYVEGGDLLGHSVKTRQCLCLVDSLRLWSGRLRTDVNGITAVDNHLPDAGEGRTAGNVTAAVEK